MAGEPGWGGGRLQLPLEGEEPWRRRRAACARCGHMSRGEGRPGAPAARRGGSGRRYCARRAGLGVTSLPAGGAGRGGARGEQYNAAAGSAGPGGGRGVRAGRFGPSPFPELSLGYTWAPGLGRAKFSLAFWNIRVDWQN